MLLKLLPLAVFAALAGFLWKGLSLNPGELPSPLIDRPAPVLSVATLDAALAGDVGADSGTDVEAGAGDEDGDGTGTGADGGTGVVAAFDSSHMEGQVWLLNVWASWCGPCAQEHPQLVDLAASRDVPIVGLNYKDDPNDAYAWLGRYGNIFSDVLSDVDGSVGLDWGVYGVPETFVIDGDGRVRFKHVGPILAEDLENTILPILDELSAVAGAGA